MSEEMKNHEPITAASDNEEKVKSDEPAKVDVLDANDLSVGGDIRIAVEAIFSRANEGLPIYESLGGVDGIAAKFSVDLHKGLDESTVEQRAKTFGKNELPEEEPLSFFQILKDAWSDHMIMILSIAAIVSLILGLTVPHKGESVVDYAKGWIEGTAILISVVLVTTISSVNDYRKELKFRMLTDQNKAQAITVLRSGKEKSVDIADIVVGDLVSITPGLILPFDGFYVRGQSVVIDESSVTGENDPKRKNAAAPFLLMGTVVNTAESTFILVGAVGENSFGGKLLMSSRQEGGPVPTPLQVRLDEMADNIGKIGIAIAMSLFLALSIREAVRFGQQDPRADGKKFLDYFIISVAIVAVAVPEGLPLAVTISLAYSQNKMRKDNNQVRRLKACETMGNATQICSDKTGTLTQNLMSVVQGSLCATYFKVAKPGEFLEKIDTPLAPHIVKIATEIIALNSSSVKAIRMKDKEGKTVKPTWVWALDKGNKTDNALLDFVDRLLLADNDASEMSSLPHQRLRASYPETSYAIFPFTSDRKRMSIVLKGGDGTLVHHVKGGADEVLPLCELYLNEKGEALPLDNEMRKEIEEKIKTFAENANRNIGFATANLSDIDELPEDEPTGPLTWVGVVGIQDPLRPEVAEAVAKCQRARITVRMCTGDNIDTAKAISKECNIYDPDRGDIALTGTEFRNQVYDAFNEKDLSRLGPMLNRMTVLARSQPLDKQLLVLMLMLRGEVVAVTGDGTNDAPALRLANVGFVMKSGTNIAVKSADIVLLDDNFRSVQRAVVWGRTVNDNIRKFLQLQLCVNVVSVLLTFIGSLSAEDSASPLTTVQLLWINLIMDTFAALALATEEPNESVLERGPVNRKAPLISRRMMCFIGFQAAYQLTCTLVLQNEGHKWFATETQTVAGVTKDKGSIQHSTVVFNVFVWMTIFNMFNARKLYQELNIFEGFRRSMPFFIILSITCLVQSVAVEFFRDFINTRPLNYKQWLGCLGAGIVVWPVCFISKLVPIREPVLTKDFDKFSMKLLLKQEDEISAEERAEIEEEVDEDMVKMLLKLRKDINSAISLRNVTKKEQKPSSEPCGSPLEKKMRAQALWGKVKKNQVVGMRVVNTFRRARLDNDMKSAQSLKTYQTYKSSKYV